MNSQLLSFKNKKKYQIKIYFRKYLDRRIKNQNYRQKIGKNNRLCNNFECLTQKRFFVTKMIFTQKRFLVTKNIFTQKLSYLILEI